MTAPISEEQQKPAVLKKKHRFLRRGEGIQRFGRIAYPKFSKNVDCDPDFVQSLAVDVISSDDVAENNSLNIYATVMQQQQPENSVEKFTPTTDSGCPPSTRMGGSPTSPEKSTLSDTKQFELIEDGVNNEQSLDEQSSLYRRFISGARSSPRVLEFNQNEDRIAGGTEPPGAVGLQNASSVRTSDWRQLLDSPISISSPTVPSLQQPSRLVDAGRVPFVPNVVQMPKPPQFSTVAAQSSLQSQQTAKLEAIMTQIQNEYVRFKSMEKMSLEELDRRRAEMEMENREERVKIERQRREFEEFRDQELLAIRKATEALERQKHLVDKRESEQVKLLKEQIADLQNDICERDSRTSAQRAKVFQLEKDLNETRHELGSRKFTIERLEQRCAALETANAKLRTKSAKIALDSLSSDRTKTTQSEKRLERPKSAPIKSVRFNLPDENSPCGAFMRTDDHCTQTSFLEPQKLDFTQRTNEPFRAIQQSSVVAPVVDRIRTLPEGSKEIFYNNNTKYVEGADGKQTFYYINGDIRRLLPNGTEVYYYASNNLTTETEPDGTRNLKFDSGRRERHLPNGTKEIKEDDVLTIVTKDGHKTETYPDGTKVETASDASQIVTFPDGSTETRQKDCLKRVFPDGNVKYIYKDGTVVTKYKDGRIRVKDAQGALVQDQYYANKDVTKDTV